MAEHQVTKSPAVVASGANPTSERCIMLIFGASGDLTKRLLVPALYNLACDGLLHENFAVLGTAMDAMTTEQFRERMSADIKKFHTRKEFDQAVWDKLIAKFHYVPGSFGDANVLATLKSEVARLDAAHDAGGNVLFYFAVAPKFFGLLCENLHVHGFKEGEGWKRIIVEKPFGTDLASALKLNREVLANWSENQIYRVDHYLGKETVQNLLAFRFSNGMFEPLWNKNYIDNIQFNVSEAVDVEGRGGYYDSSGVLRDMMQNHMFQMLAYLCMEVPGSFEPDAIRNEKAKLLQSVREYTPDEVARYCVRGQYGPSLDKPGYRQEKDVNPESKTETYAAARFHIDNWRWEGVPIYLRSGKALWKRGTEIVVEFKKAPEPMFRGTPVTSLAQNRLIFHIQPYQGIEIQFQAKIPGPRMNLQPVHMKFGYGDAFKASRYTGYEVMIYACSHGDATLFSRGDLVEAAWRVAQPILDSWRDAPVDFPNYIRSTWGPKAAAEMIARDGRRWHEVVTEDVLKQSPLFRDGDTLFLEQVIMALKPRQVSAGEMIITKGEVGREMYLLEQGEVEVLDDGGNVIKLLTDGDVFGEVGVLLSQPRNANVRAKIPTDLYVLDKADFSRILRDNPNFAFAIQQVAKERFSINVKTESLISST
ncbi:MAG: glucose-6-phosphate dehydrogenase [Deltaproteobacteria bacterium]|nr:glucose-6-phosphate dehydrogenase [Deltaproteobacteria bacterium]MCW5802980.1 glucose-6-phosphate dehydrogenase [Deltaproteobacteria bacterium]